jgi:hypothetical protein
MLRAESSRAAPDEVEALLPERTTDPDADARGAGTRALDRIDGARL